MRQNTKPNEKKSINQSIKPEIHSPNTRTFCERPVYPRNPDIPFKPIYRRQTDYSPNIRPFPEGTWRHDSRGCPIPIYLRCLPRHTFPNTKDLSLYVLGGIMLLGALEALRILISRLSVPASPGWNFRLVGFRVGDVDLLAAIQILLIVRLQDSESSFTISAHLFFP